MKNLIKKILRAKRNSSLITIDISGSALMQNLNQFQNLKPNMSIAPVLKSNAYGHGLIEIAKILDGKVPFFIIDSYFEAEAMRNEGIKTPLLIIGYVRAEQINNNKLKNISFTINSLEVLYSINSKAIIHLKIDTGMNRQGMLPGELPKAVDFIKKNKKNITLEGICSHLADADSHDSSFTEKQIELWNKIDLPEVKYRHLSNTFGHKYSDKIRANTSRLGLGLYGLAEIDGLDLKPVLEMKTIITSIKKIKGGDKVGYAGTFTADHDMTIATVPVGYYEGIDRRLSNKGFVKIGNIFCPIVGRVSMNITTIDVSKIVNAKIGDEVIVISNKKQDKNSVENIAKMLDSTIPYEISVHIPSQLKRVVIR